jgi:hypothetical protein
MPYRPPHNDKGPDDYFGEKKEPSLKFFTPFIVLLIIIAVAIYFSR